jgi:flagellin-like hook-associated protein FlgL
MNRTAPREVGGSGNVTGREARAVFIVVLFLVIGEHARAGNPSLDYLNTILSGRERATDSSIERLSTGRILLTDDPAGYAIDQALEKYIRGLDKTIAGRGDMISYYRVEDAMLASLLDILQRIEELALQRTNGILSDDDREIIDAEIDQQLDEIRYVLSQAEFNTKKIFADLTSSEAIGKAFNDPKFKDSTNVEALMKYLITRRGAVGAVMKGLEYSIKGDSMAAENMTAARTAQDTEYAGEASAFERGQLLLLVNILMLPRTTF